MRIEVNQLAFAYGAQPVLRVTAQSFESGKIYGLIGRNGVGKTTFFKALTNIITNYTGTVAFDGVNVKESPKVLTKVGITLDDMELFKGYSGLFNLRYFGGLRGNFDEARAIGLARSLGLEQALGKKVSTYSLGMNKKLILLISLMNDADLLIFDEPFRGIDAASVNFLRTYLLGLKAQGKLILISSHVQEDIESLCDQVLVLAEGDFRNSFDLTDTEQPMVYTVTVSHVQDFIDMLPDRLKVLTRNNQVRFDSTPADFRVIFKKATAAGIAFDEINKESKFSEFVK